MSAVCNRVRCVGNGKRALGLLDHAVNLAQPEPAAFADLLGCKEGLYGRVQHVLGHAGPAIPDRNAYAIAVAELAWYAIRPGRPHDVDVRVTSVMVRRAV